MSGSDAARPPPSRVRLARWRPTTPCVHADAAPFANPQRSHQPPRQIKPPKTIRAAASRVRNKTTPRRGTQRQEARASACRLLRELRQGGSGRARRVKGSATDSRSRSWRAVGTAQRVADGSRLSSVEDTEELALRNTNYIVPAEGALTVFTDGACLPSPRRGGIGIRFVHSDQLGNETVWDLEEPGYVGATNNQMELQTVITAMKAIEDRRVPAGLLENAT